MRNYDPPTPELVRVVAEFLERVGPSLDSGQRYEALVCVYLLRMVERELETGPPADRDEQALAAAIRAGEHDANWVATLEQVLDRTIERVRLTKPDHLAEETAGAVGSIADPDTEAARRSTRPGPP
jgi:hypothetical protein